MKYKIMMTYQAESFCTVEANSEEELKAALRENRYEIYEDTCGDTEHYYILSINEESAAEGFDGYPEVFPWSSEADQ